MTNNTSFRSRLAGATSTATVTAPVFRKLAVASAISLALTAGWTTSDAQAQGQANGQWVEGQVLVRFRAGLPEQEKDKILKAQNGRALRQIQQIGVHIVEVPAKAEAAVIQALARNPHVESAELDMLFSLDATASDPYFGNAWHLPKIQAPTAWDTSQGNGVTVAILDTGVDPYHPDLASKLLAGWNSASSNTDTTDIYGHGTKVAGSAAAITNNSIGVAGVAGVASILPVRVTNDSSTGSASTSAIANGLTWAADRGAHVANISYGVTGSSTVINAAKYFMDKGGLTMVSAGNSGADPGFVDNDYMISVSATNSGDTKTSWSSYGYYVDVTAPGEGIWTTVNGGGYGTVSGTSFSSPITAGVVALMKAANPSLPPADLEKILKDTADDLGASGWDTYYGYGRVNAAKAVAQAASTFASDIQPPTVSITSPTGSATVSGLATVDVSATDNVGVNRVDLHVNNQLVASDNTAPYGFSWDTTKHTDGSMTLVAVAYDAANQGTSKGVLVTVKNSTELKVADTTAPTVAITSPSNGAKVTGVNVSIKANASDNVAVTKITAAVDGKTLCTSSSVTLSCNWNIKKVAAGAHTISAIAEDAAGNKSSTSISVTK